jgi:hypothetical protein
VQPEAIKLAIAALTISFLSLIGVVINSVLTAKTYKKNRRLEFLQRRDHLSQKISELNDRNMEAQLISARYELVAIKNAGLTLRGEHVERNTALIASIKVQREGVEKGMTLVDENIKQLHSLYTVLTLESDAPKVESLIASVQVASDDLKKGYDGYVAVLHILETTNELMKTTLAEADEKIRQSGLDFERAIDRLTKK